MNAYTGAMYHVSRLIKQQEDSLQIHQTQSQLSHHTGLRLIRFWHVPRAHALRHMPNFACEERLVIGKMLLYLALDELLTPTLFTKQGNSTILSYRSRSRVITSHLDPCRRTNPAISIVFAPKLPEGIGCHSKLCKECEGSMSMPERRG